MNSITRWSAGSADAFDTGIADLRRTAEPGGVFCCPFVKAVAVARADEASPAT